MPHSRYYFLVVWQYKFFMKTIQHDYFVCGTRPYLGSVLPDAEIPDSNSLFGFKLLTRHVHIISILVFIFTVFL